VRELDHKPFWIWNVEEHKQEDIRTNGDCCFNHIIGLPQKDGNDKPLYDYEQLIFDSIVTHNGNSSSYYGNRLDKQDYMAAPPLLPSFIYYWN
jgi:hypothetical protein